MPINRLCILPGLEITSVRYCIIIQSASIPNAPKIDRHLKTIMKLLFVFSCPSG